MKMGKIKGERKSSKDVRKENRPYPSDKSSAPQKQEPEPSQLKHTERSLADSSEEEEGGGDWWVAAAWDDLPLSSRRSWNMNSSSLVQSTEVGIAPLPPVEETHPSSMAGPLMRPSVVAVSLESGAVHPPARSRTGGQGQSRKSSGTPASPVKGTAPAPLAPARVLVNSQRENCPDLNSSASFLGLLTPTRRDDLKHHPADTDDTEYFLHVPDEVLLHIFSSLSRRTLSRAMQVCRKWNRVGYDEMLWRRVDMSFKKVSLHSVTQVLGRGATHLKMAKTEVQGNEVEQLGFDHSFSEEPSLRRLQYLDLSMAAIDQNCLTDILSTCRQLKKVSLEHVEISDAILHLLAENPALDTLNLAMCRGVTSSGLMPLFAQCPRLTQLNVAWCGLDQRTVSYVCGAVPDGIQFLNISGSREALSDEDVQRLCQRCKSLVELDLSDSPGLTDASLYAIAHSLSSLICLSINRCYHVGAPCLPEVASLPNLRTLNVIGMLDRRDLEMLKRKVPDISLNGVLMSSVARPTIGNRRSSIWEQRVRYDP